MKIGIILPDIGNNQKALYTIIQVNKLQKEHDFVIFFENLSPTRISINCSIMNINELWDFNNGILISTTLNNTDYLIKSCNVSTKKLFYIWDLEWLLPNKRNYIENIKTYNSSEIDLICRSLSHSIAIENYCNRKPNHVIPNFNLTQIVEKYVQGIM